MSRIQRRKCVVETPPLPFVWWFLGLCIVYVLCIFMLLLCFRGVLEHLCHGKLSICFGTKCGPPGEHGRTRIRNPWMMRPVSRGWDGMSLARARTGRLVPLLGAFIDFSLTFVPQKSQLTTNYIVLR